MDITEEPIPPIINDKYLVNAAIECGEKIWGKTADLLTNIFCRVIAHLFILTMQKVFLLYLRQKFKVK